MNAIAGALLDGASFIWYALGQVWQQWYLATTVLIDPLSMARRPIAASLGRSRAPVHIILASASTPLQLRLLSSFWHGPGEKQKLSNLTALATRFDSGDLLNFSGVIISPSGDSQPLPLAFSARIDLGEKKVTLDHARIAAGAGAEPVCQHEVAVLASEWATARDILAPLLGRTLCPALAPE